MTIKHFQEGMQRRRFQPKPATGATSEQALALVRKAAAQVDAVIATGRAGPHEREQMIQAWVAGYTEALLDQVAKLRAVQS